MKDYSRNKLVSLTVAMASSLILPVVGGIGVFAADTRDTPLTVRFDIDPSADRIAISPYIYGSNFDIPGVPLTANRSGGNRLTGYNWETNASNAGNDWEHQSDDFLLRDVPASQRSKPGAVVTDFLDKSGKAGIPYSIVTLQMAGYVAKDMDGPVGEDGTAPSSRWAEVQWAKGKPFSLSPYTKDNVVFMDEFVNFLVNKYGLSTTPSGVKAYSLDNEPALWPSTHARIHPKPTECEELVKKGVALSKAVKAVDPGAEIFGPALYGFAAYTELQGAPDWKKFKGKYNWFISYYLDQMRVASEAAGKRLLDVLDLHWYPEAKGGGVRICDTKDGDNDGANRARVQAPRTLWDKTYKEDSWIGQWGGDKIPLLPVVNRSIQKYNPGTKLAFTEYNYGGDSHVSGGLAQADAMGIFGRYGVYLATRWGDSTGKDYIAAAYNLYRNYDGKKGAFGDTEVKALTSDSVNSSLYASVDSTSGYLHIIALNKSFEKPLTATVIIAGTHKYKSGPVYGFDASSPAVKAMAPMGKVEGNILTYTLSPLSVCHMILAGE